MSDADTPLATLKAAMARFVAERDWEKFHTPKNLAMGLAVEAAELMEHFLWMDCPASLAVMDDADKRSQVGEEMADVACYLLALSNVLGIDLAQTIISKLNKNAMKYPADKYRGRYEV